MSGQIVLQSPNLNRSQPLLLSTRRRSTSFAEVAGETTADCAAVCCCCPCGIVNLLVMAIYKYPARLFRKALKEKRKRQLIRKGLLPKRKKSKGKCKCDDDSELHMQIHPVVVVDFKKSLSDDVMLLFDSEEEEESRRKVMELEKEMWERFYGAGFWRSPSQREAIH